MRTVLAVLALGLAAALSGCSTTSSSLTAKSWQLAGLAFDNPIYRGVVPAGQQALYTIRFNADGTYDGTADCNQIAGTYEVSGTNGITVVPGVTTFAFCTGDSYGMLYARVLGRATSFEIAGEQLTLAFDSGGGLQFDAIDGTSVASPQPEASPPPPVPQADSVLATGPWQLTTMIQEQPPYEDQVPADQAARYTIEFATDGTVSAQADCNTLAGTYTTGDPAAATGDLTLVGGASTLAACPEGSLSDVYLSALAGVTGYAVEDGRLLLTQDTGGSLVFQSGGAQ